MANHHTIWEYIHYVTRSTSNLMLDGLPGSVGESSCNLGICSLRYALDLQSNAGWSAGRYVRRSGTGSCPCRARRPTGSRR